MFSVGLKYTFTPLLIITGPWAVPLLPLLYNRLQKIKILSS
jgi:hypothetical protein